MDPERDEEEAVLWKAYREGGRPAYEALVDYYLPLVKATVGRMAVMVPTYVNREDLLSAGYVGLLSAIERYDPSREAKFTTYAITRVRGAILDELRSHDVLGRITRERVTRIHRAEQELRNRDESLTPEALAEEAGLTLDEYWDAEMGALAAHRISLQEITDNEEHSLQELLPSRHGQAPGHTIEVEELVELVQDLLHDKEKELVVMYYHEELTLKEIGEILGVSESRVCQLHTAMVRRIREELKKREIITLDS